MIFSSKSTRSVAKYKLVRVKNGSEALARIPHQPPDVLILDHVLAEGELDWISARVELTQKDCYPERVKWFEENHTLTQKGCYRAMEHQNESNHTSGSPGRQA